jgi:GAF domain-containing protein
MDNFPLSLFQNAHLSRYDAFLEPRGRNEAAQKSRWLPTARRRKATAPERPNAPKAARSNKSRVARKETEVARLSRELDEALERQTATADILKVIASSPSDVQPVFKAIAESAKRLLGSFSAAVFRFIDGIAYLEAITPTNPTADEIMKNSFPRPVDDFQSFEMVQSGTIAQIPDTEVLSDEIRDIARARGFRSMLITPLVSSGTPIGMISVTRVLTGLFSAHHEQLLQTFADQAVIAIENARLFNEVQARTRDLSESLHQLTATSEVLEVISSSPGELEPVFQKMLENATRVCGANFGTMSLYEAGSYQNVALYNVPNAATEQLLAPIRPHPKSSLATVASTLQAVQIEDLRTQPPYLERHPAVVAISDLAGARTLVVVPMLRENELIGTIAIYRQEVRPFSDKQVDLVANFAKQAVIAIENTRLLKELRERTDDLSESLQQQTATADVLKIISRSAFDLETVLETLVETVARLCRADQVYMFHLRHDLWHLIADYGLSIEAREYFKTNPFTPGRGSTSGRAAMEHRAVSIADVLQDPEYTLGEGQAIAGYRSTLGVPLLRENTLIGVFSIVRTRVEPFASKEIELATSFADQAVIAIENVRLFDAEQQRTRELSESLEQQTATSEVLNVISNSLTDAQPVFEAIVQSGLKLFTDAAISVALRDGDMVKLAAIAEPDPARAEAWRRRFPNPLTREYMHGAAILDRRIVDVPEVRKAVTEFAAGSPNFLASGYRAVTIMPMIRGSEAIGALSVVRLAPGPLSDKQLAVLRTFAAQAVIAIENTRLLSELRESLQQQTATADVLKVISRSTFDLQTVLQTLVESAAKLCDAEKATITRLKDGVLFRGEFYGFSDEFMDYVRNVPVVPDRGSATARALLEGVVVHIPDVEEDPDYTFNEAQRLGDFRTIIGVPMLREGKAIGVIVMTRSEVRPFTDKQIELATTFADQAAIAIENVRLFENVEARTRELAASLEDLRTAQDRLVQTEKLASLGQLTAGIAHEIKNPLNFVNNFSALSAELTDELNDVLKPVAMEGKVREEVDELTGMLKDNLEKVVQHGNRADSIVKNMLLHSRQGSGEHRPVDINAIVDESLNLAYHGGRAENTGFNIAMHRNFDPAGGTADGYPQEITRALLNLISNGFYAATKRKADVGDGFEPTLTATTKNLGDKVEIRIRDNGAGIPTELKEKIFNPFFTTKPAGEGTGLGLSMSHDIVVKQHRGTIDVVSEPGAFTEFRIVLPRAGPAPIKSGEEG